MDGRAKKGKACGQASARHIPTAVAGNWYRRNPVLHLLAPDELSLHPLRMMIPDPLLLLVTIWLATELAAVIQNSALR